MAAGLQFTLGLLALVFGAELLVRGASGLAARFAIPPLIIGLTVVALGTSTPEFAASLQATLSHRPDIAIGNVVGSNIMNVLLILGLSALILPLSVQRRLVRIDVPLMVACSAVFLWFAADGRVHSAEAVALVVILIAYLSWMLLAARREANVSDASAADLEDVRALPVWRGLLYVAGGLTLLVVGSDWLVTGAAIIALAWGVSELVVGLVLVAAGTSLPELATSIVAAVRGERDIAVGNVVGSNIFNILFIVGIVGIIAPQGLSVAAPVIAFDLPVMLATSVVCLPILLTGFRIARGEGFILVCAYAAYAGFLLLDAQKHDALPTVSWILGAFVVPLLILGILLPAMWSFRTAVLGRQRQPPD